LRSLRPQLHVAAENGRLQQIARPGQQEFCPVGPCARIGSPMQFGFDVALGQYAINSIVGPKEKCGRVEPEFLQLPQHSRMVKHNLARLLGDFRVCRSNMGLLRTGDVKRDVREQAESSALGNILNAHR